MSFPELFKHYRKLAYFFYLFPLNTTELSTEKKNHRNVSILCKYSRLTLGIASVFGIASMRNAVPYSSHAHYCVINYGKLWKSGTRQVSDNAASDTCVGKTALH